MVSRSEFGFSLFILRVVLGLGGLVLAGMMMLGRLGAGIGAVGMIAVLVGAFVSGSIRKRKLRAALAEIDRDYPSKRDV